MCGIGYSTAGKNAWRGLEGSKTMNAKEIMNSLQEVEEITERLGDNVELPFPVSEEVSYQNQLIARAVDALEQYKKLLNEILERTEIGF